MLDTGDQALSLWSGSTDSKTLEYQRTNPREYQIVRTHTKETTWIQDQQPVAPRAGGLIQTTNKNTNQIIIRRDYHLTQPAHQRKTNKQQQQKKLSTNLTL